MKMIPWQDFRYIFGEIMYGGHITDYFDRRTNNTYLNVIFNEKLLNKVELAPKLAAPEPSTMNYDLYLKFIKEYLPLETPSIYGLHPNAEIGFLTSSAEYLFNNMLRLNITGAAATASPSASAGGGGGGASGEEKEGGATSTAATVTTTSSGASTGAGGSGGGLRDMLQDLMKRCPPTFHLIELANKAKQRLLDSDGPYIVVLIQECTRINVLLNEISFSLDELQKGKFSLSLSLSLSCCLGESIAFLLTDTQINNEKYFIYLNDLLSSGNIPDLYNKDEKEAIINSLTNKAKAAGYSPEPPSVWKYFINKIKENLHVCLCFSPVGNNLRVRARRFPALANCTVIDWFQPWPEQALVTRFTLFRLFLSFFFLSFFFLPFFFLSFFFLSSLVFCW
jgi:hypothetical protein